MQFTKNKTQISRHVTRKDSVKPERKISAHYMSRYKYSFKIKNKDPHYTKLLVIFKALMVSYVRKKLPFFSDK